MKTIQFNISDAKFQKLGLRLFSRYGNIQDPNDPWETPPGPDPMEEPGVPNFLTGAAYVHAAIKKLVAEELFQHAVYEAKHAAISGLTREDDLEV